MASLTLKQLTAELQDLKQQARAQGLASLTLEEIEAMTPLEQIHRRIPFSDLGEHAQQLLFMSAALADQGVPLDDTTLPALDQAITERGRLSALAAKGVPGAAILIKQADEAMAEADTPSALQEAVRGAYGVGQDDTRLSEAELYDRCADAVPPPAVVAPVIEPGPVIEPQTNLYAEAEDFIIIKYSAGGEPIYGRRHQRGATT